MPDLEVISPQDRLMQSSAGAVACALPTGVGALGGVVAHIANAREAECSDEEILEVAGFK